MSNKEITWVANYKDGSYLCQYERGIANKYTDIDRSRLDKFELLRGDKVFYSLTLHEGQRLIYRRRTLMTMGGDLVTEQSKEVIYLVGYQVTLGGQNLVVLNYIYEDGRIELDNSRSNIELYAQEK